MGHAKNDNQSEVIAWGSYIYIYTGPTYRHPIYIYTVTMYRGSIYRALYTALYDRARVLYIALYI